MAVILPSVYKDGTATVNNGSTTVTGQNTLFINSVLPGDFFGSSQGVWVRIASVDSNTTLTLAHEWPEATQTAAPYEIMLQSDNARMQETSRQLLTTLSSGNNYSLAQLSGNVDLIPIFSAPGVFTLISKSELLAGVNFDVVVDDIAGRAAYDNQNVGFTVLVINTGDGRSAVYAKDSATPGDWSNAIYITGPAPNLTIGTVQTLEAGEPATASFTGTSLNLGLPAGELNDSDKALLDQKVAQATAEANRAASYTSSSVAGSISGLTPSNHPDFPNELLAVSPGTARSSDNTIDIVLPGSTYKNILLPWATGPNAGGLDTGAIGEYSHYHIFVIRNETIGYTDILFSASPINPVMPAGYTKRRRIGAFATGFAGRIMKARWFAGDVQFSAPSYQPFASQNNSALVLRDVFVPKGVKMKAKFYLFAQGPTAGHLIVSDPDAGIPNLANSAEVPGFSKFLRLTSVGIEIEEYTDTNGRCYFADNAGTGTTVSIWAKGWYDHRDSFA